MKKLFISSIVLFAALTACNKEEFVSEKAETPAAASFTATIAPDTKISYTSDGAAVESFTTAFDGNENVFLWTNGAANDYYNWFTTSASLVDGKKATFKISTNDLYVNIPATTPVSFGAYMVGYNCMNANPNPYLRFGYNNAPGFIKRFDFSECNGTLVDATKVQTLYAEGSYDGTTWPDLTFSYLTSILKVDLTLSAGSGATPENTVITVSGEGMVTGAQLNTSSAPGTIKTDESGTNPQITISPDASVISGDRLTFYVPLWAGKEGVTIKNATIDIDVDGASYSIELAGSTGKLVAPGKVYTFSPAGVLPLQSIDRWVDDAAGSVALASGLTVDGTPDGLSYDPATGEVSWVANTTGRPVEKNIAFIGGLTVKISQLEPDDFKGGWNLKSRLFNPNGGRTDRPTGTTGTDSSPVTISSVTSTPETLDDHVNNYELSGLYSAATMKVALEIDYAGRSIDMGLFFDRRTTQLAKSGVYCAYIPELAKTKWGSYVFAPAAFGVEDCNYEWMWLKCEDFETFRYIPHSQSITYSAASYYLVGISIVISSNSGPSTLGTSYNTIYQANYNLSDTEGLSIVR